MPKLAKRTSLAAFRLTLLLCLALGPLFSLLQGSACAMDSGAAMHACCAPEEAVAEPEGCCDSEKPADPAPDQASRVGANVAYCQCAHGSMPEPVPASAPSAPERPQPLVAFATYVAPPQTASVPVLSAIAEIYPPPSTPTFLLGCAFLC